LNEIRGMLNQVRNQKDDPDARARIDADVHERQESYHQALADLRKLVGQAQQNYAELATNKEVSLALEQHSKRSGTKLKLGPSPQHLATVKQLERLEQSDSDNGPGVAPDATARHTRKSSRTKRIVRPSPNAGAGATGEF